MEVDVEKDWLEQLINLGPITLTEEDIKGPWRKFEPIIWGKIRQNTGGEMIEEDNYSSGFSIPRCNLSAGDRCEFQAPSTRNPGPFGVNVIVTRSDGPKRRHFITFLGVLPLEEAQAISATVSSHKVETMPVRELTPSNPNPVSSLLRMLTQLLSNIREGREGL